MWEGVDTTWLNEGAKEKSTRGKQRKKKKIEEKKTRDKEQEIHPSIESIVSLG